jgi:hypothetical protein
VTGSTGSGSSSPNANVGSGTPSIMVPERR